MLITGIAVDRIMGLSNELTGLATNPSALFARSCDKAEVLVSLPKASAEPGSVCEETLPVNDRVHPAVKRMKTIRTSRITGRTIPAGKRERDIG